MDLTVNSYRTQQPAFKGFIAPSANRLMEQVKNEKVASAINEAAAKGMSVKEAEEAILHRADAIQRNLSEFVKGLHEQIGLCSGTGTDALFKLVHNNRAGMVTSIPTTDIFEKVSTKDAFEAMEYVANKLSTEAKQKHVVHDLILQKMMTSPAVVEGRQITLRPRNVVLQAAEKFAKETNNIEYYNKLVTATEHESAFVHEYSLLHNLLKK